jgi:NitT/TauT family transport system substrate-binding protein
MAPITRVGWIRALLTCMCAAVVTAAPAFGQEKVTYSMGWLPQGSSIGVIVAQERGFFRDLGLDVKIVRGYGGPRVANELDQRQIEFGYVDPITIALHRSNGGKTKMIGAINTRWPASICWLTNRMQPKSIDDLRGKKLGGGSSSQVFNVLPYWLEINGKPRDLITLVRLDPAVVDTSFIGGRIDLAECWKASNRVVIQKLARDAGVEVGWMDYADFGLDVYGSGFATSDAMIAEKPETVRRFLRASYHGFEFAQANPEQATAMLVKMFPTSDRAITLAQVKEIGELLNDPQVRAQGLGYIREDRMTSTLNFVDKAFGLKGRFKTSDIYTNNLLK